MKLPALSQRVQVTTRLSVRAATCPSLMFPTHIALHVARLDHTREERRHPRVCLGVRLDLGQPPRLTARRVLDDTRDADLDCLCGRLPALGRAVCDDRHASLYGVGEVSATGSVSDLSGYSDRPGQLRMGLLYSDIMIPPHRSSPEP
jgi:hypothetical protein